MVAITPAITVEKTGAAKRRTRHVV